MDLKYKDGNIAFDLSALLQLVKGEDKVQLIESLSCDDDIIDHVTNQILDGWTINGYHGARSCHSVAEPSNGLNLARRRIAKECSKVAREEIENLEKALAKARIDYYDLLYKR